MSCEYDLDDINDFYIVTSDPINLFDGKLFDWPHSARPIEK